MSKKALVVINPHAGMRKSKKALFEIIDRLSKAGYSVTAQTTTAPGDATRMAKEFGPKRDLIVCCGGDGTLNEIINGIREAEIAIPIGYIPAGTTNDFARSLGLKTNADWCMDRIIDGFPRNFDIGSFNGRNFTYIASLGAFTDVSYSTPQKLKNALGHTAYLLEGAKAVKSIAPFQAELWIDDEHFEGEFLFGAITNSTSVGGLFRLDRLDVRLDDGELELMFIRNPKNPSDLNKTVQSAVKRIYDPAHIIFRHCKEAVIRTKKPQTWTLDGENGGEHTEVHIAVQHKAIRIFF